jgi:outer membrane protein OmpA-like peptidoglycan-associated protein
MRIRRSGWSLAAVSMLLMLAAVPAAAQGAKKAYAVQVPQGEKVKVQGVVSSRNNDMFTVRDTGGAETTVILTADTKVSSHNRGIRGKKSYPMTYIMRGLRLQSEGRGDVNGYLVADWVRFDEQDLRSAQAVEQTAELAEDNAARVAAAEEEARKLAAQIEETDAVARAAKIKADEAAEAAAAAQSTANQAYKDAAMANARINGLDSYDLIKTIPVLFKVGSSTLTKTARAGLEETVEWAKAEKANGNTNGWLVQVVGFADTTGKSAKNRALSDRRAKTVIDYLVLKHNMDLRRLVQPYGYGENKPIASNKTAAGRAQNRRVEIRILQNKGIANKLGP